MNKEEKIILTNEFVNSDFNELYKSMYQVFHFPMISTVSIEYKDLELNKFDFIIFTSKNGVRFFHKKIKNEEILPKIISLGSKTAEFLKKKKFVTHYIAKRNYSHMMVDELSKLNNFIGSRVLLVQGNLAQNSFKEKLNEFCNISRIIVYKTILNKIKKNNLIELLDKYECYTVFTSPSCFDAFCLNYNPKKTQIISIGNTTTNHIVKKGFEPLLTSKMQTYEGICQTVLNYLNS